MAEINDSTTKSNQRRFSRSRSHRTTRVDLTPMVDLGFLLITFFVFTTAMSTPKVMDLDETKGDIAKPIPESGAMTILIAKDHQLFYYYGMLDERTASTQITRGSFKEIRNLITLKKKTTTLSHLMYVIKADKNSTFGDEMNIMDEMIICGVEPGHYAEAELTSTEEKIINSIE